MLIYKIFRPSEWAELQQRGTTSGAPVDRDDGYVHFSTVKQLPETLAKHFAAESRLMLLACEAETLGDDLLWEKSRGGQDFPHLYRLLRMDDVLWARLVELGPNGHEIGDLA
ncbi:DUF952 domain-containing protein [Paracoccus sp. M683]|uniref:DUF952 domain-containing protein n=1 Tax=Paracoccus sp. M683 TaxID=2594268 RepID=UPI00117C3E69|nr:DUF952 domain-containing protein [Paracoccus sp. M683]TRW96881.1 DUF952 domain-containing protein [Paracoccus sp. M683]